MCYQITEFPRAETDLLIVHRSADIGRRNLLQGPGELMLKNVRGEVCEMFERGMRSLYVYMCECVYSMYVFMCLNT